MNESIKLIDKPNFSGSLFFRSVECVPSFAILVFTILVNHGRHLQLNGAMNVIHIFNTTTLPASEIGVSELLDDAPWSSQGSWGNE